MFLAVIGIRLCSGKLHHARQSALHQVLSCLRAMLHCGGKNWTPQKICHCAFVCAWSQSIALCAFICARSNSSVFSRNDASFCQVLDSLVKRRKSSDVFFLDLKNLQRSAQNLIIPHKNLKCTKCFNSWHFTDPMTAYVNIPQVSGCTFRGQMNWGAHPSIALFTEAKQKLPSGGEGSLTRRRMARIRLSRRQPASKMLTVIKPIGPWKKQKKE